MKALILVSNNLSFDTRNKTQITAIAQEIEEVHVSVRPIPDETFHLNLPNVTYDFFHYEAKQYPITPALRESAKQLGVYDELVNVFSLLKYDDYYNPIVIQKFVDDLDYKMQGDRWAEVRKGICEPMEDNIAISYPLNLFEVGTQWAQEVIKIPADVVLCNNIDTLLCGVAHKIKYGSRLIYDSPDIYCDVKPGIFPRIYRYVLALFEKSFAKYADVMLGASVGHLEWFKNHYSLTIPCIPIYSCTVEDSTASFEPKKPQEKLRIYYHGMMYTHKDFEPIIKAMLQVDNILFVLRCWPSEHLEQLKCMVEENSLKHRVQYLEPVTPPEIADAARRDGDIGIFICETENDLNYNLTLPNKFIEYLRAGLPIIISPLEEQSKIVEKYQCGYILKDNSVESIVAVFRQAIAERERLYKMSENSLKVSKELFDWQIHKKTLLAVIMGDQQTIEEKAKEVGASVLSSSYDLQDMERKLLKLNEYSKDLEKITGIWQQIKMRLKQIKRLWKRTKSFCCKPLIPSKRGKTHVTPK